MADIILFNANGMTMDDQCPRAKLIVIEKDFIRHVSPGGDYKPYCRKNTLVIDCRGKTVLPGFIDAHFHFNAFAESFLTLDLSPQKNIRSIGDLQLAVQNHAVGLLPGQWVKARGYNEFYIKEKRHPDRWDLDAVAPYHPVKLTHRSGHAHVLNSEALKSVGISRETPDPPGGLIERHIPSGEPTGLLYEMGEYLSGRIPASNPRQLDGAVRQAGQALAQLGITSVQDGSGANSRAQWNRFASLIGNDLLNCRVTMMMGLKGWEAHIADPFESGIDPKQLRLGCVKIILDQTTGSLNPPQEELNEIVRQIHSRGYQLAVHAIEASAVESVCSAVADALRDIHRTDHRHRIEHCSVCPPALAGQMAAMGIMVVTQPAFLYYNGDRYLKTVSDRQRAFLYPLKTLLKKKVKIAGSSDCPIVPPNPLVGIAAAVTRTSETGAGVGPDERIDATNALKLFTRYAAESAFEETLKGTLSPGKVADIVVLDGDPTRVPPEEIKSLKVQMTIGGGRILHRSF